MMLPTPFVKAGMALAGVKKKVYPIAALADDPTPASAGAFASTPSQSGRTRLMPGVLAAAVMLGCNHHSGGRTRGARKGRKEPSLLKEVVEVARGGD